MENHRLEAKQLRKTIKTSQIRPGKVRDDEPLGTIIGQKRALKALNFGVANKAFGFNIYVSGIPGTGRTSAVKNFIRQKARKQDVPADWCYVNNFRDAYHPRSLKLPPGRATVFRDDMENFIGDVKKSLGRAFESAEYQKQSVDVTLKFRTES